jgi:hypothetical protein
VAENDTRIHFSGCLSDDPPAPHKKGKKRKKKKHSPTTPWLPFGTDPVTLPVRKRGIDSCLVVNLVVNIKVISIRTLGREGKRECCFVVNLVGMAFPTKFSTKQLYGIPQGKRECPQGKRECHKVAS